MNGTQVVLYAYDGTLLSHEKERSPDTCYNVDEPPKHDAEWEIPDTDGHMVYDPTDRKCPEQANPERQKADAGLLGVGGKGEWEQMLAGFGVSF